MDRERDINDRIRRVGAVPEEDPRRSDMGRGRPASPAGADVKHGIIATTVKGAFKISMLPVMRTRAALATLTGGWSDLVAEARQEYEARGVVEVSTGRRAGTGVTASQAAAPAAEVMERPHAEPSRPTTPGGTGKPRASRPKRGTAKTRPGAVTVAPSPVTGPVPPNGPETPAAPTLIEAGESGVEVRPNPAISPAHATSGVICHMPPEVRHKLGGNGPIRA